MSQVNSLTDILDKAVSTTANASADGDNFQLGNEHEAGEWLSFTIGMFFDGTLNNKENTKEGKEILALINKKEELIRKEDRWIEQHKKALQKINDELSQIHHRIFELREQKVFERQIQERAVVAKDYVPVANTRKLPADVNHNPLEPLSFKDQQELNALAEREKSLLKQKKNHESDLNEHILKKDQLLKEQKKLTPEYMEEGSSYYNDYTNVARLFSLYEDSRDPETNQKAKNFTFPIYVEGIGTARGQQDEKEEKIYLADGGMSPGTGSGSYGVTSKVEDGCKDIANEIRNIFREKENKQRIKSLTLDVFGFSRGAAAARHFANEVIAPPEVATHKGMIVKSEGGGKLREAFKYLGLPWPLTITIRFIGVFDTVVTVTTIGKNPNTNLKSLKNTKVVHLVAQDEIRHYFSLTTTEIGEQHSFPGVHSDIGGSYNDEQNVLLLMKTDSAEDVPLLRKEEKRLIKDGWFKEDEIGIYRIDTHIKVPEKFNPANEKVILDQEWHLIGRKFIFNDYSLIPLSIMHELAIKASVPFKELPSGKEPPRNYEASFDLHPELEGIKKKIRDQVIAGSPAKLDKAEIRLLREKYLHLSAHYTTTAVGGLVYPNKPTDDKKRVFHREN